MRKGKIWALVIVCALSLGGCGTAQQEGAKIGNKTDDLKASKCAGAGGSPCQVFYRNGHWIV